MCVGLRTLFNDDYLDFLLGGPLGGFHLRLLRIYFRHVRLCRVVLEPDPSELGLCAVEVCDCRLLARRCEHRLDYCLQLRRKDLATRRHDPSNIELSERAPGAGLVRMRVDTLGRVVEYCHCCTCCCQVLRIARKVGPGILAPSGYVPETDRRCISCGACARRCPMGCRVPLGATPPTCIGCGLCVHACPRGAVRMRRIAGEGGTIGRPARRTNPLLANILAFGGLLYLGAVHRIYERRATARGGDARSTRSPLPTDRTSGTMSRPPSRDGAAAGGRPSRRRHPTA